MMNALRSACPGEEFDYGVLMTQLSHYKHPRDKITRLLASGAIVRVKKGLYVFGSNYRRGPVSLPILANLIYGPSYVSEEFALAYHGLIPEKVEVVTCMTTQRKRNFITPVGSFVYRYLNLNKFTVGIDWEPVTEDRYFLLASPEKALADRLAKEKRFDSTEELLEYLIDGLRIDESALWKLDSKRLKKIATSYRKQPVYMLESLIERGK